MSDQIRIDENTTWVVAEESETDEARRLLGSRKHVNCVGQCTADRTSDLTGYMNADAAVRHLGGGESASSAGNQTGGGFVPWPLIVIPAVILLASIAGSGTW